MRHAFLLATLFAAGGAAAQAVPNAAFDEKALRATVSQHVAAAAAQLSRFEVQVGPFTPRADLPPCARAEHFLPPNARSWGRLAVGVRCVEGAAWTVMVPVTVRAWAPALVATASLPAGTAPGPAEVQEQEMEVTREPALPLRDLGVLQGRSLVRMVAAGQALRADMLRATLVVQAGDPVRLHIAGPGFQVHGAGQALSGAAEGQAVRVRTDLGKILTGVAREGRVVDVAL